MIHVVQPFMHVSIPHDSSSKLGPPCQVDHGGETRQTFSFPSSGFKNRIVKEWLIRSGGGGANQLTLDIQNPPVIPCEKLFGTPKSLQKGDVWGFKCLLIRYLEEFGCLGNCKLVVWIGGLDSWDPRK